MCCPIDFSLIAPRKLYKHPSCHTGDIFSLSFSMSIFHPARYNNIYVSVIVYVRPRFDPILMGAVANV